jgi:alpha-tubulin suppressor-like RCC1 family protein
VSGGDTHACGIRNEAGGKNLYCWGNDNDLQAGQAGGSPVLSPTKVVGATDWRSVSAGVAHSCAVRESGALHCWGWNGRGQLGDGTRTQRSTIGAPLSAAGVPGWREVTTGGFTSCALSTDERIFCWGDGELGTVGNGQSLRDSATSVVHE